MSNDYVNKALELEKLVNNKDGLEMMLNGQRTNEDCSGFTAECVSFESSSLLGGGSGKREVVPPNFITECFFLCHMAISFIQKKIPEIYMKNNEQLNKAIGEKNYPMFDEMIA